MSKNSLVALESWLNSQVDGQWEHQYGVSIESLDNPGWLVKIDLTGTNLARIDNDELLVEQQDGELWIRCEVKENTFLGYGSVLSLDKIIQTFLNMV